MTTLKMSKANLKKVANEFPVELATLSKLNIKEVGKALSNAHMGFGRTVRNVIRQVDENFGANPIELDATWKDIIQSALAEKLYNVEDYNPKDLRSLQGLKQLKPLKVQMFKGVANTKAGAIKIGKAIQKANGLKVLNAKRGGKDAEIEVNKVEHKMNRIVLSFPTKIIIDNRSTQLNRTLTALPEKIFKGKEFSIVVYVAESFIIIETWNDVKQSKPIKHNGTIKDMLEKVVANVKMVNPPKAMVKEWDTKTVTVKRTRK